MSAAPLEAVLGGTFDPVHLGHVRVAEVVRGALGLPRVLLLPTAVPPHKDLSEICPLEHRIAMLRLVVAGHPGLQICGLELESPEPTYTIDTLRRLRGGPPSSRPVFILGRDALIDIPTWRLYRDLLREFDLLAIDRLDRHADAAHDLPDEVRSRLAPVQGVDDARKAWGRAKIGRGGRIFPLRMPEIPVSSSEVRRRAGAGEPLDDLVPSQVARYIRDHALYRE